MTKKVMYNAGIYQIKNKVNNCVYYGSSSDLYTRKVWHFSYLKRNKHPNKYLQRAYNKYGKDNFLWSIMCFCDVNKLLFYEQLFIDSCNNNKYLTYNLVKIAGSVRGRKVSEEQKRKHSLFMKGNKYSLGKKNGLGNKSNTGRKLSLETRNKLSKIRKGKKHSKSWNDNISKAKTGLRKQPLPNGGYIMVRP